MVFHLACPWFHDVVVVVVVVGRNKNSRPTQS